MERVAVLNLKGGIGKTTTAVSLAVILAAEHRRRVLLVDCDMQGNASKVLGRYRPEGNGTHTIMQRQQPPEYCIFSTEYPAPEPFCESGRLDIIPANMYLMQANAEIMQDTESEQLHILDEAIKRLEEIGKDYTPIIPADRPTPKQKTIPPYDTVIFDCALGLDMTVLNAVIASDLIIAPVPFGGYEVDGLQQLQEQLDDLKAIKPGLRMKALFTMKQGNKANKEFEQWLHENSGYDVFKTAIRRSVTAQKATLEEMPLPVFSKNGAATKDYREVAQELIHDLDIINFDRTAWDEERR